MLARDAEEGIGAFLDKREPEVDGGIAWSRASRSSRWASAISTAPSPSTRRWGSSRNQAITDGVAFFQMGGIDPWPVAARRAAKDAGVDDAGGRVSAAPRSPTTRAPTPRSTRCWPRPRRPAADRQAGGPRLLGRLVRLFRRHRWPSLGGRAQPGIPDRRRRQHLAAAHEPRPLRRCLHLRHPQLGAAPSPWSAPRPNDVRPSFFVLKYLLAKGFDGLPGQSRPCRQGDPRPQGLCASSPTFPSRSTWSTSSGRVAAVPGIVDEVAGDEAAAEGRLDAAQRAQ